MAFHIHEEEEAAHTAVCLIRRFSFNPAEERGDEWNGFEEGLFFIPSLMLTKTADGDYLTVNQWAADGNQAEDTLKRLKSYSEAFSVSSIEYEEYPVLTKAEELDVENWLEAIKTATNDMKANQYDKVVLAREVVLSYDVYSGRERCP